MGQKHFQICSAHFSTLGDLAGQYVADANDFLYFNFSPPMKVSLITLCFYFKHMWGDRNFINPPKKNP